MNKLDLQIRWLIRRDMPEVLQIERDSFAQPWDEDDFIAALCDRNVTGMVAEVGFRIVAFMVYELHPQRILLLNFAVDADRRRMGVGSAMVNRLVDKLSIQRRKSIIATVRESNLSAQLFFRAQAFRAVAVERGGYEDTGEDSYVFRYTLGDLSLEECGQGAGK